jgi:hypothetical protein
MAWSCASRCSSEGEDSGDIRPATAELNKAVQGALMLENNTIRLRPHHLICNTYISLQGLERNNEQFMRAVLKVRDVMLSHEDTIIQITEGVDGLCALCPDCRDLRCGSPQGDEDAVRKWDARILQGLGLKYGETRTAKAVRDLVAEKAPLEFCRSRCPWKNTCDIFQLP